MIRKEEKTLERLIRAWPLTRESFAPLRDVLQTPAAPGRASFDDCLCSVRPEARASLSLLHIEPAAGLPLAARLMELHEFCSQTFIPLVVGRWPVAAAPPAAGGGAAAMALLAGPGHGITYGLSTWYIQLMVVNRPTIFAMILWRDGTAQDQGVRKNRPILGRHQMR